MVKRHTKPDAQNQQGGILDERRLDPRLQRDAGRPEDGQGHAYARSDDGDKKVRVAVKTGSKFPSCQRDARVMATTKTESDAEPRQRAEAKKKERPRRPRARAASGKKAAEPAGPRAEVQARGRARVSRRSTTRRVRRL